MIIRNLTLHNFGVYAGTNTFDFHGEKPVVLIGGLNGRGKTTFLNAVLLALYGNHSSAYKESKYSAYGKYLNSFINLSDGTKESYLEIKFTLEEEQIDTYVLRRSWNNLSKATHESLGVWKNGEYNPFLTDHWDMYIENILPHGLADFFFFDGEKIAEIAASDSNDEIKNAIKQLLGITVIDTLESDIQKVRRMAAQKEASGGNKAELAKLEQIRDEAQKKLAKKEAEIRAELDQQQKLVKAMEAAQAEYRTAGGGILENQGDLYKQKSRVKADLEQDYDGLITAASGILPLYLVRDLISSIADAGVREQETRVNNIALKKIREMLADYQEDHYSGRDLDQFVKYVEDSAEKDTVHPVFNLSANALTQAQSLKNSLLGDSVKNAHILLQQFKKDSKKLGEIDNYLSVNINEEVINKIFRRIKKIEQAQIASQEKLKRLEPERSELSGQYRLAAMNFNKYVENMLTHMEAADDHARIVKYSDMAFTIFAEFKKRLQYAKLKTLSETITDCYKQLTSKKNLIDQIVIDPEELNFSYFDSEEKPIEKDVLSAGEKQLLVIAILWGIGICSKRKLPVIIDTPLSRLDSKHRTALIQKYFPRASDQTIILSTDTEITKHYYDLMKPDIGDEFTLIYDDESRSTTIKRGYFEEGLSND